VIGSQEIEKSMEPASLPLQWRRWPGIVAGFGDRFAQPPSSVVRVRQVHGTRVVTADGFAPGLHGEVEADAVVVRRGTVAAVATADCVPILLADPAGGWAAAVHSGWRGTIAGVVAAAVAVARDQGVDPRALYAALGPSIGPCCYEVGTEVASVFSDAGFPVVRHHGGARPRIDLRRCNERLLSLAGLLPERIRFCGPCTRCRSDLYHSYRADRERADRQLSWIGWVAPAP
jgi:YfiH family protein